MGWALLTLAGMMQPSATVFTIGVLRRDALIVPFATYDGKGWKNEWPAPADGADVPLSVRSVPKAWWGPAGPRDTWQLWTPDLPPLIVKVRQPDWASSYCHKAIGLRTDYQPRFRPPPLSVNPYPKDGLAVSPPHPVEAIEVLGPDSSERDDVVEAIHPRVVEREQALLYTLPRAHANDPRRFPPAPTDDELRAMPPMAIEALYAYGTTRRWYYVEGAREYKRDGMCTAVLLIRGMITHESGKWSTEGIEVHFTACDRSGENYMLPLGVVPVPTGLYWIAQTSGWSGESYNIIDITGTKAARRSMPGGGC
jgi:hypothetical protein